MGTGDSNASFLCPHSPVYPPWGTISYPLLYIPALWGLGVRRRVVGIPIHAKPNSKVGPLVPQPPPHQAPSAKNQEPRTKNQALSPPQRVDQLVQLIDDLLHIRLVWRVVGEEAERADAVGIGAGVVGQFGTQGRKGYLAGLAG